MDSLKVHVPEVLIVEENEQLSQDLRDQFTAKGYLVRVAHTGPAAIATAVTYRHHAMIVDLDLLDMDGLELLSYLKEIDSQFMPIVLMNQPDAGVKHKLIAVGAFACLVKPCNTRELDALVSWVIKVRMLSSNRQEELLMA